MTSLEDLLKDLPEVVGRMRHRDVHHLSLKNGADTLALTLTPTLATSPDQAPRTSPAVPPAKAENTPVSSPEMGVFCSNGLSENQSVRTDEIVGFIEAGPLRLPVTATADGTLGPALVKENSVVGYHEILFRIQPNG